MPLFRRSSLSPDRFYSVACLCSVVAGLLLLMASTSALGQAQAVAEPAIKTIYPTFTTIDVPGAVYSLATAINNENQIVGVFGQDANVDATGFLYENGTFTTFYYPANPPWTAPYGINDLGLIVGHYGRNPVYGFTYDGTTFTTLQDSNDNATFVDGINNAGLMVGGQGTIYTTKAFQLRGKQYKALNVPGQWIYVEGNGINNHNEIVGSATDGATYDGFKCQNGTCQTFTVPGSDETAADGLNDQGTVVGWYGVPRCCIKAFVLMNGQYLSFSYPGAIDTYASGINNADQVVGEYTLSDYSNHGFVTSPITAEDAR